MVVACKSANESCKDYTQTLLIPGSVFRHEECVVNLTFIIKGHYFRACVDVLRAYLFRPSHFLSRVTAVLGGCRERFLKAEC